ncbi:Hypothetical predicted protein [Octopus vulgaris]|uniref:Uncharacterized protein n=1 Tax=Octopus vulgaris TaxID=6645 RepID=A0AA36EWV7_OCTVU|nr:Hypothetical predicted protein [Octopus vulgaris]
MVVALFTVLVTVGDFLILSYSSRGLVEKLCGDSACCTDCVCNGVGGATCSSGDSLDESLNVIVSISLIECLSSGGTLVEVTTLYYHNNHKTTTIPDYTHHKHNNTTATGPQHNHIFTTTTSEHTATRTSSP